MVNQMNHIPRISRPVLLILARLSAFGCVQEYRCSDVTGNVIVTIFRVISRWFVGGGGGNNKRL